MAKRRVSDGRGIAEHAAAWGALFAATAALAQQAPVGDTGSANGALNEIIVTAEKHSESLQKVPLSIVAYTAETLAVHLWYTHSESIVPDVDRIGNGSALVLLIMVLIFNVAARVLGRQLTKHFTGRVS